MTGSTPSLPPLLAFEINGEVHRCAGDQALDPLLDYLRDQAGLKGTKEGCRSGECGACMVLVETSGSWQAINSCLATLGQLHGRRIVTIEGVATTAGRNLHPAQEAMIDCRAAQCGFCTPGMVMALVSATTNGPTGVADTGAALAGNLCRCTGYRPIREALSRVHALPAMVPGEAQWMPDPQTQVSHHSPVGDLVFLAPATLDELLTCRQQHPEAVLLAGGTDLMNAWHTGGQRPRSVISLRNVAALGEIIDESGGLRIGSGAPLNQVFGALLRTYPELAEFLRRFASPGINAMATLAGNLQTASPVGDLIPLMIALGACVELSSTRGTRSVAVEAFITGRRSTALAVDEVITAILLPARTPDQWVFARKVAKRFDQDITSLSLVANFTLHEGRIESAKLCCGGMSAAVYRAARTEAALTGRLFNHSTIESACLALGEDYQPIDDLRGSAAYRRTVAANLLRKLLLDYAGTEPVSLWRATRR